VQALDKASDAKSAGEVKSPGNLVPAFGDDAHGTVPPRSAVENGIDERSPDSLPLVEDGQEVDHDLVVVQAEGAEVSTSTGDKHATGNRVLDPPSVKRIAMCAADERVKRVAVGLEVGDMGGDRRIVEVEAGVNRHGSGDRRSPTQIVGKRDLGADDAETQSLKPSNEVMAAGRYFRVDDDRFLSEDARKIARQTDLV
jgi:hypothetical protein